MVRSPSVREVVGTFCVSDIAGARRAAAEEGSGRKQCAASGRAGAAEHVQSAASCVKHWVFGRVFWAAEDAGAADAVA